MFKRYKPKKALVFDWTPNLAYAVGLIVTDGSLSSNGKNVIFTSQDIEQIGNIKLILNLMAKLGITRNKTSEHIDYSLVAFSYGTGFSVLD